MNQYIVNEPQAKAINDGASLLIVEIDENRANDFIKLNKYSFDFETLIDEMQKYLNGEYISHSFKNIVSKILPLKEGDEIFIAEEFYTIDDSQKVYFADTGYPRCITLKKHIASEMTEQQSRFKFKVGEVRIKRVMDMKYSEVHKALHGDKGIHLCKDTEEDFLNWLKDQGINYSANPWVALAELKEI